jgi:hypothetical protein
MTRERRLKPVAARDFFFSAKNTSVVGTVGFDASSFVLGAISRGEPGEGGVFERVVAELLFMDHRRLGTFRWPVSCRLASEAAPGIGGIAALSVWELARLKKLDMLRLKLDVEPRVERLERGTGVGSWSAAGVAGIDVDKVALSDLLGVVGLVVLLTAVSRARGGLLGPGAATAPARTLGKGVAASWSAASDSWALSECTSGLVRVWKSWDWRPLTGVTGSFAGSLSVSSPSSRIELVRSVGNWRGEEERLDKLEELELLGCGAGLAIAMGVVVEFVTAPRSLFIVVDDAPLAGAASKEEVCVAAAASTETAIV